VWAHWGSEQQEEIQYHVTYYTYLASGQQLFLDIKDRVSTGHYIETTANKLFQRCYCTRLSVCQSNELHCTLDQCRFSEGGESSQDL